MIKKIRYVEDVRTLGLHLECDPDNIEYHLNSNQKCVTQTAYQILRWAEDNYTGGKMDETNRSADRNWQEYNSGRVGSVPAEGRSDARWSKYPFTLDLCPKISVFENERVLTAYGIVFGCLFVMKMETYFCRM